MWLLPLTCPHLSTMMQCDTPLIHLPYLRSTLRVSLTPTPKPLLLHPSAPGGGPSGQQRNSATFPPPTRSISPPDSPGPGRDDERGRRVERRSQGYPPDRRSGSSGDISMVVSQAGPHPQPPAQCEPSVLQQRQRPPLPKLDTGRSQVCGRPSPPCMPAHTPHQKGTFDKMECSNH